MWRRQLKANQLSKICQLKTSAYQYRQYQRK